MPLNRRQRTALQNLRRASGAAVRYARELLAEPTDLDRDRLPVALRYAAQMKNGSGDQFGRAVMAAQALSFTQDPRLDQDLKALRARVKSGELSIDGAANILLSKSGNFGAPKATLLAAYRLALQDENMNIRDAVADVLEHDAEEPTPEEIGPPPEGDSGPVQFSRYGSRSMGAPGGCTEAEMQAALKVCRNSDLSFDAALAYVRERR